MTFTAGDRTPCGESQENDLRVMSFNVRYGTADDGENRWDNRKELVAGTIHAHHPDLLGTQEALHFQRDFLAGELRGYECVAAGRDDGHDAGEMMAIFFRRDRFERLAGGHFWLSETPDVPGSRSWDSALPRMATWVKLRDRRRPDARPVFFVNTHFDYDGVTARLRSCRIVLDRLRTLGEGCSAVLTGDFNDGEDSETHRRLFGAGEPAAPLVDTYRQVHPHRNEQEGTFCNFSAVAAYSVRIDWIGCTPDWQVVCADIDRSHREGRTPSDHFPVTAVLRR